MYQGRSTTYRDLDQLIRAREYYTKLEAGTQPVRSAVRVSRFRAGGAV